MKRASVNLFCFGVNTRLPKLIQKGCSTGTLEGIVVLYFNKILSTLKLFALVPKVAIIAVVTSPKFRVDSHKKRKIGMLLDKMCLYDNDDMLIQEEHIVTRSLPVSTSNYVAIRY